MKIILYLMNEKGKKTLETLLQKFGTEIILSVVCSKDKNVQNDFYDDIKRICSLNNIIFLDKQDSIQTNKDHYKIAIGWRWIIDDSDKLIVLHDSLLPKYRGFSPLVSSLINGEKKIGVTALFANKDFDKGDIVGAKYSNVQYPITIEEAIKQISLLYQSLIIDIILKIKAKRLIGTPQIESDASYSIWRDESDYHINWNNKAKKIARFIDAVGYPYRGASAIYDGKKVRVIKTTVVNDVAIENRHCGKVIFIDKKCPVVICKKGLLRLDVVVSDETNENILPLKIFRTNFFK